MENIALQIERLLPGTVSDTGNVVFDSVVYSSGNIGYNNGIITIGAPGVYSFNWWVAAQSSSTGAPPIFTLFSSNGDAIKGDSPDLPGEVVGFGIIRVITPPVNIRLTNTSGADILYSQSVPVKAGLTVIENNASTGPQGPAGPQGPMGPQGPQGSAGLQGTLGSTSYCFAIRQFAYVLDQLIRIYSTNTWGVATTGYPVTGKPYQLNPPQNLDAGSLVITTATGNLSIPLWAITAVFMGTGTVYDPTIKYLPAPSPLPSGCDAQLFRSIQSYLSQLSPPISIYTAGQTWVGNTLLANEFGLVVLASQFKESPVFVPAANIAIYGKAYID